MPSETNTTITIDVTPPVLYEILLSIFVHKNKIVKRYYKSQKIMTFSEITLKERFWRGKHRLSNGLHYEKACKHHLHGNYFDHILLKMRVDLIMMSGYAI